MPHKVTIHLNGTGGSTVLVDGFRINACAIAVTSEVGELTEVTLVLPGCEVDMEIAADIVNSVERLQLDDRKDQR